jgi:trimeric autotransporter adhesin
VLVADFARLRVVAAQTGTFYGQQMTAGDIYTIAGNGQDGFSGDGGPATEAAVVPLDAAVDQAGNVIIASYDRVRAVAARTGTFYGQKMTAGDIYTIAGNGTAGFAGNGGLPTAAEFSGVGGVSVDSHGDVAIDDQVNGVVWLIAARTGSYYGLPMTAGHIYVVAGYHRTSAHGWALGTDGLGDGGPATRALIVFPAGVSFAPSGDLLVADADNRIRTVSAGSPS